jgi:long-subunit fatty acid transport protein
LLKDISIFSNLTYIRKKYLERLVTLRDYKQRDNLYSGTMGLLYQLNKRNSFTVSFTYRQNASNDSLEDYSENVINCGWQYNF